MRLFNWTILRYSPTLVPLTTKVKIAPIFHCSTSAFNTKVETIFGVVTLIGMVSSLAEKGAGQQACQRQKKCGECEEHEEHEEHEEPDDHRGA